jgi:hypothetical protein
MANSLLALYPAPRPKARGASCMFHLDHSDNRKYKNLRMEATCVPSRWHRVTSRISPDHSMFWGALPVEVVQDNAAIFRWHHIAQT